MTEPGGSAGLVPAAADLEDAVAEAAEECPGECIFIERDYRGSSDHLAWPASGTPSSSRRQPSSRGEESRCDTIRWSGRTDRASMCQVRRAISASRTGRRASSPRQLLAQLRGLVDGREVGEEDRRDAMLPRQHPPRHLGRSSSTRSSSVSSIPSVTSGTSTRQGASVPVRPRSLCALRKSTYLVADHRRTGTKRGHRQRPRTDARFEDAGAGNKSAAMRWRPRSFG